MKRLLAAFIVCCLTVVPSPAQEKSVRPGINKPFENPDPKEYVKTFEGESREIAAHAKEIVAACKLKPGMVVADVGAGTGLFTRKFAGEIGENGKVFAVDIAPTFLRYIENTCQERGIKNVQTILCDQFSTRLPKASVDLVFICDTYHHFEFPQRTLASIHEALRPGGQLILIDFHRILGKSRLFVMGHVRAGQEVFVQEITTAGFKLVREEKFLKENYFVRFEKKEQPQAKLDDHRHKKLIEWGWDEPDTRFMRANIGQMEQMPFDGLVFHAISAKGDNLAWEVWGTRKFAADDFTQAVDDLKATKFNRFTDRFLRVNVTPAKVDWFDDESWACVVNNFGVAAQVAKEGRCKGFMFDTEQYEGVTVFDYRKQKRKKTFAEYQAKVRQRGQQWVKAVNKHYPNITILLTFGYEVSHWRAAKPKDRSTGEYGLLADFLDGVLDAATRDMVLVDAWEFSYPYKERKQFEQAYEAITKKSLEWTVVPEKYKSQVKAGFGIWMDHRRKGWDVTDFSKNYFSPAEFETAVRSALQVSDGYVWIYSERPKWWTKDKLPSAYIEALANARKSAGGEGK
jgi:predicted methyltransferase